MRSVRTYLPGSGASEGHPSIQASLIALPIVAIYGPSPLASPTTDKLTSETAPGLGRSCANANPTTGNNTQPTRIRPRIIVAPLRACLTSDCINSPPSANAATAKTPPPLSNSITNNQQPQGALLRRPLPVRHSRTERPCRAQPNSQPPRLRALHGSSFMGSGDSRWRTNSSFSPNCWASRSMT
jgi:hypothetical protein